jgi:ABC-type uncharacterized transport system involved in gliding motility auxiliary subunit
MSARRFALIAALALAVIFVAANLTANVWFRGARLDLTENRLYTLSAGSQQVLRELREPVEITFYFSSDAAAIDPELSAFGGRVRELLQTFQARSGGMLRVVEVNPEPYTAEEDAARTAGMSPVTLREGADPVYLGVGGASAVDDRRALPFLDPRREPFLEYDLTRLIYVLDNPDPVRAALITSLPLDPESAADPNGQGDGSPMSVFAAQFGAVMDVEVLPPDFTDIPEDVDLVAVIHPPPLSEAQVFALDQFVLRKGRAFIALDPASILSLGAPQSPFGPAPTPQSSRLDRLLSAWGVEMTREVVMDRQGGFAVPVSDPSGRQLTLRYPLFLQVAPDRMARDNLITADLERDVVFGLAGGLRVSDREGRTAETLARTSGETMLQPAEFALSQPDPMMLEQMWSGTQRAEILAVQLSGTLQSAFPEGAPEGAALSATGESAPLTESATPAEVVVFADTDFLLDQFYVDPAASSFVFDNGALALNALDRLGGAQALIALRSRAPANRRMTMIDDLEQQARQEFQRRLDEAEAAQRATEQRLAELQAGRVAGGPLSGEAGGDLSPEEQRELGRFLLEAERLGREVRTIRGQLRRDVDQVQATVTGLNLWLAPLLVAAAGVFLFARRSRRGVRRRSGEAAGASPKTPATPAEGDAA